MTYELFFRMKDIDSFTWQLNDGEEITPAEDTYTQYNESTSFYLAQFPENEQEYLPEISWITLTIEDSSD